VLALDRAVCSPGADLEERKNSFLGNKKLTDGQKQWRTKRKGEKKEK
jgi:hypothetical protein